MGARQEGRKKKKSIKAKITSQTSGKRLLSRFGKQVKKGLIGPSTDYITRSAALKRLQVSLKDFRRLCILKGIYPRVPPKAPKGSDKVYYDIKDLAYLSHEPLLQKFRDFKSFMKKIRKAAGRKEFSEARRRDELKPIMNLDHLVKERYPRFIDALRDMDDALCMVHLFAVMPSAGRVTSPKTLACAELSRHWLYYVAKSRCLHKVFVSVKGFYYQAEVMGEKITWLVPHQFTQSVPKEVDLRVMTTFLDFYEVFMRFALYKLYHLAGLKYPPVADKKLLDAGCCLLAIKALPLEAAVEGMEGLEEQAGDENAPKLAIEPQANDNASRNKQKHAPALSATGLARLSEKLRVLEEEDLDDDEDVQVAAPLAAAFSGLISNEDDDKDDDGHKDVFSSNEGASEEQDRKTRLFSRLKFFVSREVPLEWIQVCTLSFGGAVGWEDATSPFQSTDSSITHYIVDRPIDSSSNATREYVQPQWIFDSINAQFLLPTLKYRPGVALPPHLSPFVDDDKEGYVPKYRDEVASVVAGTGQDGTNKARGSSGKGKVEKEELDEEEGDYARGVAAEKKGASFTGGTKRGRDEGDDDEEDEDSDDDSNVEDEEDVDEEEEEEIVSKKGPKGIVHKPVQKKLTEDEEANELAKDMMGKKTKRLYGRMQHGIQAKETINQRLRDRAAEVEANAVDGDKVKEKGSQGGKDEMKGKAKGKVQTPAPQIAAPSARAMRSSTSTSTPHTSTSVAATHDRAAVHVEKPRKKGRVA